MIAIYGASGFGRELAWLVECCQDNRIVVCFIDDDEKKQGSDLNGIPIVGLEQAAERYADAKVIGGIGNPKIRETLMKKAASCGFNFGTVVHPRVEMSRWIEMGDGVVICAGNILTTNIRLGEHVQINLGCTIGHDVIMGDYTTLSPGVHVSGWVHMGKRVYIGTGAVIINGTEDKPLTIGDDAVIGAGACVTRSVPPGQTWGGGSCCSTASIAVPEATRFDNWLYPEIEEGKPTKYNWMVQNVPNFRLGYKTDIGAFTYINAKYGVTIEDNVQIGSHCSIYSISTIDEKRGRVVLKKGCRIGSHSLVMPGVTVGENSVIGAFSFVNQDIPANVVAVGVPAKVIKNIATETGE